MMQKQKCGVTYFLVVDITMEDMTACIHPESSRGPRCVTYAHSMHQWEPWMNDQTYKPVGDSRCSKTINMIGY